MKLKLYFISFFTILALTGCLTEGTTTAGSSTSVDGSTDTTSGLDSNSSNNMNEAHSSEQNSSSQSNNSSDSHSGSIANISITIDGAIYGTLSASEEIAFVTVSIPSQKGFYVSFKTGIYTTDSDDKPVFVAKGRTVNLLDIEAKVNVDNDQVICNEAYLVVVSGFSQSQLKQIDDKNFDTESIKPLISGTVIYNYKDGTTCNDGKPIGQLQFSDTLMLGSWGSASPTWVNADNMTAHLNAGAGKISQDIDFAFLNEPARGVFFMSPNIAAGQQHASRNWSVKNTTKFIKVDKDLASILNQAELKALWSSASFDADQKTNALATGDIILLETNEAKIVAIKVISLSETPTNDGRDKALIIGTLGDKAPIESNQ